MHFHSAAATRPSMAQCLRQTFPLAQRSSTLPPPFLLPFQLQTRNASSSKAKKNKKNKKKDNKFDLIDTSRLPQFSLLDAMRYLKAAEVGRPPNSSKYEIHLRFKTLRSGSVIRNRVRLPHPVKTDVRVAVVVAPDSAAAVAAQRAGAVLVGEDNIIEAAQAGRIEFDKIVCHPDSLPKFSRAGLGRVLGPKGLMPSAKLGNVVKDVAGAVKQLAGASEYRERSGTVRMAVGQLGYTPEELQRNIKTFVEAVRKDAALVSDRTPKEVYEVVLSSTNGPGLTLNGDFKSATSVPAKDLAVN